MWREEQQALLEIQELSHQNGIELHLIIFPIIFSLDENSPFVEGEHEISRFANDANIPVYSLTEGLMGQVDHTLWVSANDQYLNEKGHLVASDSLFYYAKQVLNSPKLIEG